MVRWLILPRPIRPRPVQRDRLESVDSPHSQLYPLLYHSKVLPKHVSRDSHDRPRRLVDQSEGLVVATDHNPNYSYSPEPSSWTPSTAHSLWTEGAAPRVVPWQGKVLRSRR
jgi:hypothetical protein